MIAGTVSFATRSGPSFGTAGSVITAGSFGGGWGVVPGKAGIGEVHTIEPSPARTWTKALVAAWHAPPPKPWSRGAIAAP